MRLPLIAWFTATLLLGCEITAPKSGALSITGDALDVQIKSLMSRDRVEGLAVAIVEADEITHLQSYGYRNVAMRQPLELDTIMYGASLTKAAFAYMVLQLVDEQVIDLDRPIADYLDRPLPSFEGYGSLQGDDRWRAVTARIILSHRTGLANLRFLEPDHKLRFHFKPGKYYSYSGEGFWLLQLVLEEGLGLDVKQQMQRRVFDRFDMPNTDMQWREDFADNLADGYAMDGSFEPHDARSNVSASGSMDTTIVDQARLWRGMLAGEGLSAASRKDWTQLQFSIRTAQKFPTIQMHDSVNQRGAAVALGSGLGVEVWQGPGGLHFAKGGHNPWTANLAICQQRAQRCLIMLANSVRAELIFPELAELVLGKTGYPWWWVYPALHGDRR